MKERPIEAASRKKIAAIKASKACPKDFACVARGFRDMCSAEDYALPEYIRCLEPAPNDCSFSLSYGPIFFCRCPMRVFLMKSLGF